MSPSPPSPARTCLCWKRTAAKLHRYWAMGRPLCQPKKKRGCQGSPQILNRKTHSPYRRIRRKPHVQIIVDRLHQLVQFMLEKMVRATDLVMMDGDALLRPQLVDQLLHGNRKSTRLN